MKSLKIIANDLPNNNLIKHFDHCFELIDKEINENNGKVLVHCYAGISRSATIVCGYVMKKYKLIANEAIIRVKTKRSKTNPNKGFVKQLKLYQILNYTFDCNNERHKLLFGMI